MYWIDAPKRSPIILNQQCSALSTKRLLLRQVIEAKKFAKAGKFLNV
ncbi:hypothetical protein [Fischerella muscicola]|nr:hypothetical protein [Fischerella muscicola]